MKQIVLGLIFIITILSSCSSSLDSDAKKAAILNRKSMECTKELKLEEAEKLYKESRSIIARYKDTEKFDEFYKAYNQYMAESIQK